MMGHIKSECKKLKENGKRDQSRPRSDENEKEITTVVACDEGYDSYKSQDSTWEIDSAASFHITF